ncbi:MAG: hypothetical protein F6K26_26515 [Moorea sp. SIO2I5]|nr:hypothetical protein [Moorena sp. SIO2I5]
MVRIPDEIAKLSLFAHPTRLPARNAITYIVGWVKAKASSAIADKANEQDS